MGAAGVALTDGREIGIAGAAALTSILLVFSVGADEKRGVFTADEA
jgi:hypothetical protein